MTERPQAQLWEQEEAPRHGPTLPPDEACRCRPQRSKNENSEKYTVKGFFLTSMVPVISLGEILFFYSRRI